MSTIKIETTQNIELEYDLASVGERLLGYLVDLLVIIAYCIVVLILLSSTGLINRGQWMILIFYIPVYFYDLVSEISLNGQSVGKRVMNIKVISLDGAQPTLGQYLIRWVFRLVDFPLTGYLGGLFSVVVTDRRQRIGDIVAGTTLIKTLPRTNIHQTIYTPVEQLNYKVLFPEVVNLSDTDMQLIKEVVINVNNSGNLWLAHQAADKIKQTLGIQTALEPSTLLRALLSDYNYLTGR